jgi:hypothetical protein
VLHASLKKLAYETQREQMQRLLTMGLLLTGDEKGQSPPGFGK